MRKIRFLLVALFALIGVRAFAALPEADQKGFLYNLGSGQFITADATLGETGVEFTIEIKEKDANATPSVDLLQLKAQSSCASRQVQTT